MAVLQSKNGDELIISCNCRCGDGLNIRIDESYGDYCYQSYLSSNWYQEQGRFLYKLRKIWAIIRNKDFYYSEIIMSKDEWQQFKEFVNKH